IFGRDREKAEAPSKVAMPTRLSYPIGEKSDEIMLLLRDRGPVSLKNIFIMSRNRSELTAYFMAVLELYRSERIGLDEGGDGLIIRLYNL
ncbi:MAG: hypothetical protein GX942_09090, partial [Papillibacter sp.]|nr:hypothetical protein [Papillibacter sp.]